MEAFQIICIEDASGGYTVWLSTIPNIIIQVETLNEIPEKYSNVLHDILKYKIEMKMQIVHKIEQINDKS